MTTRTRLNHRAIAAWRARGSQVIDWQRVVQEYKEHKEAGTLAQLSVATVADAVLYMHAGLRMRISEIGEVFISNSHHPWFNHLALWASMSLEAQQCFSLASHVRDKLPLADAQYFAGVAPERQASGAENLLRDRVRQKRTRVLSSGMRLAK